MTTTLADMFAAAQAWRIDWEDEPLYAFYEIPAPAALTLQLLKSASSPVQGLALKTFGGTFVINDVEAAQMLIWADTAPEAVQVRFKPAPRRKLTLKVWNIWRSQIAGADVTQAWLGNAGMRVAETDHELFLRCSDGEGAVDFTALEARLTIPA